MEEKIKKLAQKYLPEIIEIREHLHKYPELAYEEEKTAQVIEKVLDKYDIPHTRLFNTGVVGIIEGKKPGKVVLLRGDMDALPILEQADIPYKSVVDNVMHACGHDGHTANLLGVGMILTKLKNEFSGTVKLMFQPAEETEGGARQMIGLGILENPKVDAAFGLHLMGTLEEGKVEVKHGPMMGAPDEFTCRIMGRGGHAASPEQCIDPISVAVQFMNNAQHILTRRLDPMKPALISFCRIHAGDGLNVIPNEIEVGGTIRTLYPEIRKQLPELLEKMLNHVCAANDATYELNYHPSYPPLINDAAMTDLAQRAITKIVGIENVSESPLASLGAEDFAYLCEAVPSTFYYVGIHEAGKPEPIHHHPEFTWRSECLEICMATLSQVAVDFLSADQ